MVKYKKRKINNKIFSVFLSKYNNCILGKINKINNKVNSLFPKKTQKTNTCFELYQCAWTSNIYARTSTILRSFSEYLMASLRHLPSFLFSRSRLEPRPSLCTFLPFQRHFMSIFILSTILKPTALIIVISLFRVSLIMFFMCLKFYSHNLMVFIIFLIIQSLINIALS